MGAQRSLRGIGTLGVAVAAQQETLGRSRDVGSKALRMAASKAVQDVRARLIDIEGGAGRDLEEYGQRRRRLGELGKVFGEQEEANAEYTAVVQCRAISESYAAALRPLANLSMRGDRSALGDIGSAVSRLVEAVQCIRTSLRCDSGKSLDDGDKKLDVLIASLENRTVDAVIKARAAFVNMLDNEFRKFGWPMKIPMPSEDGEVIEGVNFIVEQLAALQDAASMHEFVYTRTRWQHALSDSWAVACILRAPLDRFRYHFLESFRADVESDIRGDETTSRFDRPEWAAGFAVERIQEATPFLREIKMSGPQTAEVKFIAGFCRVFADKIAYDCELAMRASKSDSDADSHISHAALIARQFDTKLKAGAMTVKQDDLLFPSALAMLSTNTVFFTAWASSELRLASIQVNRRLEKIVCVNNAQELDEIEGALDVEAECGELLQNIGDAGSGCHELDNAELVASFLRLTELPLLQMVRAQLRETLDECEWTPKSYAQMLVCARTAWCAHIVSELLDDRGLEAFYAKFEETHAFSLYTEEIERLKSFTERAICCITEALVHNFTRSLEESYMHQVRFGQLPSQDAAVVLAHDLSEALCKPMIQLGDCLRALNDSVTSRKMAASIWRPVASQLDGYFFDEVLMQAFAGGLRNAAASDTNAFLKPRTTAKMARQIAFDVSALVSVFEGVSSAASRFLPRCTEAALLLRMAAARVMRPKIAVKQGHDEAVQAVLRLAGESGETEKGNAREAMSEVFGVKSLSVRECLELFSIAGLHSAIPLG